MYTKCAECPMFVEENSAHVAGQDNWAEYVHLMNDDRPLDAAFEATHEARPDLTIGAHDLAWWAKNGDPVWQLFDAYAKSWVA